ncbi:MAG: cysteine desulfurase family protein [Candidatus Latescibacterota bacterium]|nr:cysteine desulfurase family protein [Candidatus Latescibacterota bacterium]
MATTPVDPRVLAAMLPFYTEQFGNPASRTHAYGLAAAEAVEKARAQVADFIGARPREILFTSGATEANSLAIKGVLALSGMPRPHVVTCGTEHRAVLDTLRRLRGSGDIEVTEVGVNAEGEVDLGKLRAAMTNRTILLCLMAGNNETGTVHDLEAVSALVAEFEGRVLWHCDAAQAVGKIPLNARSLGIDLLSISAHKIYGPKGQGALFVRRRRPPIRLLPLQEGGGQERGLRSGTLNVPGIVGLGTACAIMTEEGAAEAQRVGFLRDCLQSGLECGVEESRPHSAGAQRLPGCLNMTFPGTDGTELMLALRDIALSAGSACSSGDSSPSHVLAAMGVDDTTAFSSLRFGIGRFTTEEEIDRTIGRISEEVGRLRLATRTRDSRSIE